MPVRKLCERFPSEYWREMDAARAYPKEFVAALTEAGYLATLIPEQFGGAGLTLSAAGREARNYPVPQILRLRRRNTKHVFDDIGKRPVVPARDGPRALAAVADRVSGILRSSRHESMSRTKWRISNGLICRKPPTRTALFRLGAFGMIRP